MKISEFQGTLPIDPIKYNKLTRNVNEIPCPSSAIFFNYEKFPLHTKIQMI